jgi:hypothetical protein
MRIYALTIAATAALFASHLPAFSQGVEIGPGGVRVQPYPYYQDRPANYRGRAAWRGRCAELRQACLHKEELGEEGQGNCRRYRHYCTGRGG